MPRKSFTVGIVGLGFGRAHIPAFQAHGCEVIAVCQRDEAAARAVAERYGVPHVFDRWERMLTEAKPEIVVIATPPALHEAIALARALGQPGGHLDGRGAGSLATVAQLSAPPAGCFPIEAIQERPFRAVRLERLLVHAVGRATHRQRHLRARSELPGHRAVVLGVRRLLAAAG